MTQEIQYLVQSMTVKTVKQLKKTVGTMKPTNYLEKQLVEDLELVICKDEEALEEILSEKISVFYFQ